MASSILILLFLTEFSVISNVQGYYRPTPKELHGRFNAPFELICNFKKKDPNVEAFSWFRDTTVISNTTSGYSIFPKSGKSILKIENLHLNDENPVYRFGPAVEDASNPLGCRFPKIKVFPEIETNRPEEKVTAESITVRRDNGDSVRFTCRLTNYTNTALIPKWEFSPEKKDFHDLPNGVLVLDNDLTIDRMGKDHRGFYRCSFANRDETSEVLLRMNDRYAAWLPFFGIVIVVVICVIIILAIEKRRKVARKAAAAAADADKTADPLVVQTNKTSQVVA